MDSNPIEKKKQGVVKAEFDNVKSNKSKEGKIPLSTKSKNVIKQKKKFMNKGRGIIFIGCIPHGFYEDEMKSYFNQFGKVLGTFVARSKKTGRSKGYGFVEFEDEEVAQIAAETMNNYLMFNRIIKCRYIPKEERKGKVFESKIRPYNCPRQKNRIKNDKNNMTALSKLTKSAYLEKAQKKVCEFQKFFKERGIDFTFQLNSEGNVANDESEKSKTKASNSSSESRSNDDDDDDDDDEFGVLEIDESENEISFETPSQVKKIIKKSFSAPATNSKQFQHSKKPKAGKSNLKAKVSASSGRQKLGKKTKGKEKLTKSLKLNKKFLVEDVAPVMKQKKKKEKGTNGKIGKIHQKPQVHKTKVMNSNAIKLLI